jgi:hypothetical protein
MAAFVRLPTDELKSLSLANVQLVDVAKELLKIAKDSESDPEKKKDALEKAARRLLQQSISVSNAIQSTAVLTAID